MKASNLNAQYAGATALVGFATLSGGTLSSPTLDLNTDECYILDGSVTLGATTALNLFFNSDVTSTDYDRAELTHVGTTGFPSNANDSNLWNTTIPSGTTIRFSIKVRRDVAGTVYAECESSVGVTSNQVTIKETITWRTTGVNITAIKLVQSSGNISAATCVVNKQSSKGVTPTSYYGPSASRMARPNPQTTDPPFYDSTLKDWFRWNGSADVALNPYPGKYHPDRPPAVNVFADEEFYNDTEALSWAWGIQGSSSLTFFGNTLFVNMDASTSLRWRYINAPTPGTDFAVSAKQSLNSSAGNSRFAIAMLTAGTVSAPTQLWSVGMWDAGSFNLQWRWDLWNSATSVSSGGNSSGAAANYFSCPWFYSLIIYTAASKAVGLYVSWNGLHWTAIGSGTATNHPTAVGILAYGANVANGSVGTNWFRVRNGQTGLVGA